MKAEKINSKFLTDAPNPETPGLSDIANVRRTMEECAKKSTGSSDTMNEVLFFISACYEAEKLNLIDAYNIYSLISDKVLPHDLAAPGKDSSVLYSLYSRASNDDVEAALTINAIGTMAKCTALAEDEDIKRSTEDAETAVTKMMMLAVWAYRNDALSADAVNAVGSIFDSVFDSDE